MVPGTTTKYRRGIGTDMGYLSHTRWCLGIPKPLAQDRQQPPLCAFKICSITSCLEKTLFSSLKWYLFTVGLLLFLFGRCGGKIMRNSRSNLFVVLSGLDEKLIPSFYFGRVLITSISLDPGCISFFIELVKIPLLAALGLVLLHINMNRPPSFRQIFWCISS